MNLVANYINNPRISNDKSIEYNGTRLNPDGSGITTEDGNPLMVNGKDKYGNTDLSLTFLVESVNFEQLYHMC
ncbi:MAG: hypothetical protein LBP35_05525 [Candidatus Ancillula trichonymphae]|nr:hypothetical protein [Candidatus Ancillula trichonymphae]